MKRLLTEGRRPRSAWLVGTLVTLLVGVVTATTAQPGKASPGDTLPQAVQKGVNYLIPDVNVWTDSNRCIACHRQGGALFGLALARSRGYNVNDSTVDGIGHMANDIVAEQKSNGSWDHFGIWHRPKTSYAFFGLAAYDRFVSSVHSDAVLKAAEYVLTRQNADGSWTDDHGSFPVDYGNAPLTARMIYGLVRATALGTPSQVSAFQGAIDRAVQYLRSIRDDRGGLVMKYNFQTSWALIGLAAAGVAPGDADMDVLIARQLAEVSGDGKGWGYEAANNSDEFSTGLALTALAFTGANIRGNARVDAALNWLNQQQTTMQADPTKGFWRSAGFSSDELPTTFALLGLSSFGELGVDVIAQDPTTVILNAGQAAPQTATFTFTVRNVGAFDVTDTYDLSLQGGFPGWSGVLDRSSIQLASGNSGQVTLTVTAPGNLPEALPVEWELLAISRTDNQISDSARVLTLTNPPPPVTGLATTTTLTGGPGGTVVAGSVEGIVLEATVKLTGTGEAVNGPGKGVVTFSVAGIALGADNDADGDGTFRLHWMPNGRWGKTGLQRVRAVYSGIDQLDPNPDFVGSQVSGNLTVQPNSIQVTQVNPDNGRQGETFDVTISGSGFLADATVDFGSGITVNSTTVNGSAKPALQILPGVYVPAKVRQAAILEAHQTIVANITIAGDAELGPRNLTIRNTNGTSLFVENAFNVGEGSGEQPGGKIVVAPKKVNFKKVAPGGVRTKKLKISNKSNNETLVGTISLPPGITVGDPDVLTFSLGPKQRLEVDLIFTAGPKPGKYQNTIFIGSSDRSSPQVDVKVTAKVK